MNGLRHLARRPRPAALAAVLVAASVVVASCGGSGPPAVPTASDGTRPNELRPDLLGAELAGLVVTEEDVAKEHEGAGPKSYLVASRLWSLRTGKKLQATLQVGLFAPDAFPSAEPEEIERAQQLIVSQIGQAGVRSRFVDGREVFVTASNDLPVYVWFNRQSLFVLSVAKDYPQPRMLLRRALALEP